MPSGEYALVQLHNGTRPRATRAGAGDTTHNQPAGNPAASPWWAGPGAIAAAGSCGLLMSVLLFVIYGLSTSYMPDDSPGRVCLVAIAMSVLIVSLVTMVAAWALRIRGRRDRIAQEALHAKLDDLGAAVGRNRAVLDRLPALVDRCAAAGEALTEKLAAVGGVLDRLREVEARWTAPTTRVDGHDHATEDPEGDGGELVAMPHSRAFQLGRDVERRRWERLSGDS